MIDWQKSAELNSMSVEDLKVYTEMYPQCHKKVIAVCDIGGEIREIYFRAYRNLCKKCAQETEVFREKQRVGSIGRHVSEETKQKLREAQNGEKNHNFGKHHSEESKQKIRNAKIGKKLSKETREHMSAGHQGIPYEEWTDYVTDKTQPYLIPITRCIQLNNRFSGSNGHHITSGVVIFIPKDLHKLIKHNMKSGVGMTKINELAMNFLTNNEVI